MVFKTAKVLWKGQKATRHFTRDILQNANFNKIEMPENVLEWGLYNESTAVQLDVSYMPEMEGIRADLTFFRLDAATTGPRSCIREQSRPEALFLRRNENNQVYYFEAITPGWEEVDGDD